MSSCEDSLLTLCAIFLGELLSVYVRNLPTSVTSQEIYQEFKNFGKITQDGVFLKNRLVIFYKLYVSV